jgi:SAM-dependent methyltransferase
MGLGCAFLFDLIELKQSGLLEGGCRVVEIGAQQLSDPFLEAKELLAEVYRTFGKQQPDLGRSQGRGLALADDAPSSRRFWASLGFDYAAIDYRGHRDSIALDLNRDSVPEHLRGAFDIVVNNGTTEHVANQINAFQVIHDLVRKGGIMYHEVPAGGMMDHGMITYNPKFFFLLCRCNDYKVISMKVCSWGQSAVPTHLVEANLRMGGGQHIAVDAVTDFSIRASLRKIHTWDFCPPLEVPAEFVERPGGRSILRSGIGRLARTEAVRHLRGLPRLLGRFQDIGRRLVGRAR